MLKELSLHTNLILMFGLVLLVGYVAGRVANLCKLPKVAGYITAGVLLEPSVLGILPAKLIDHSTALSNLALCIITYAIGGSLDFKRLKEMGKTIITMTFFEATLTFFSISIGLFLVLRFAGHYFGIDIQPVLYLPLAILVGSLGAPTDPTPTLAVKEEYKADGPVTTTILGIGALDDALGIMIFSLALSASSILIGATGGGSLADNIVGPLAEITFSILTGLLLAVFLLVTARKTNNKGVMVALILGALFTCFGIAQAFKLDALLSTMTMGCVVVNLAKDKDKFFMSIRDDLEETVFLVFFVLAGAHLDLSVLKSSLPIVAIFAVFRIFGKFVGSYTGAVISGASSNVKKYTALGLVPQGGIVVGLALSIKQNPAFAGMSLIILNIILGTTVLFEFLGPFLTKVAIYKSNEVGKENQG